MGADKSGRGCKLSGGRVTTWIIRIVVAIIMSKKALFWVSRSVIAVNRSEEAGFEVQRAFFQFIFCFKIYIYLQQLVLHI